MKCPGCNADVADGSKTCPHCGRELSLGTRAVGETEHLAKETGAVIGKAGRGAWGEMKSLGSKVKKGVQHEDAEKPSEQHENSGS
ncbi:MAG TPA: zinc ribbon domain-containing protein [Thermoplasmata archaeon]|nr:zinc ribbon domain-containing protein [Thermoplasmata archaeon]